MNAAALYEQYQTKMQKIADVKYASAVLQWDQETYLPPRGAGFRGQQLATLSEMAHALFTEPATGELLQQLHDAEGLDTTQQTNIALSLEDYNKNKKLSSDFVRRMSEAVNKSFHAWIQARRENDFGVFAAPLAELVQLKKQEAHFLGFDEHPYDALLNDYDKGLTMAKVDDFFAGLVPQLQLILEKVNNHAPVDNSFLKQHFGKQPQWDVGVELLSAIGFDWEAGRQDISEHPFTTNFNSCDVRITTRIDENDFGNMTWSCLHEGGHALYEQGLPASQYGLPLGEYCSVSIHESQSRIWENCVGRHWPFWQKNFPLLVKYFPEQFATVSVEKFMAAINKVEPSLIRTEADEVTYHFHVLIRCEIEKHLIEGSLSARDIPFYWNDLYRKYLGIEVPDDRRGCLQDVHWSHGSFGYFATYSLGSLYAAQFYHAAQKSHPQLESELAAGNNSVLLNWLRREIHANGRRYNSLELCRQATGEELNSRYFTDYILGKLHRFMGL
ncbi:MAG: carboxypeptidase M32 [Ferruginibacter sp.]